MFLKFETAYSYPVFLLELSELKLVKIIIIETFQENILFTGYLFRFIFIKYIHISINPYLNEVYLLLIINDDSHSLN